MINIDDIKRKYSQTPEPKEVANTRKLITNSFKKLEFVEDVHKYFLPNEDGTKTELRSVSSLIETWVPHVDWDYKAELKAAKLGISKEELLRKWRESNITSTSNGSQTHFFGENVMNLFIGKEKLVKKNLPFQYSSDGYIIPYGAKEKAIEKYYTDILNNPNVFPVMPEAKIYTNFNDKFKLKEPYAGTFDILLAYKYKGEIVYAIHDIKTNADIYKQYSRDYNNMMLEPFGEMGFYEEPWSHYAIQLSLYQIGLMQLGIKVVDRCLIWVKPDETYEKVKTPDLTSKLLEILTVKNN